MIGRRPLIRDIHVTAKLATHSHVVIEQSVGIQKEYRVGCVSTEDLSSVVGGEHASAVNAENGQAGSTIVSNRSRVHLVLEPRLRRERGPRYSSRNLRLQIVEGSNHELT